MNEVILPSNARRSGLLVSNAHFWGVPDVIDTQDISSPFLHWYEQKLLETASSRLTPGDGDVHVIGCGTGRELPGVQQKFPGARVIGSDIAPEMIVRCERNMDRWKCTGIELRAVEARELADPAGSASVVTAVNSVLTYVTPLEERVAFLRNVRRLLRPGGQFVGLVHHRWGRVLKSAFFAAREVASVLGLTHGPVGARESGLDRLRLRCHYFSRRELLTELDEAGFRDVQIWSLAELARQCGVRCSALRSDNNLCYVATR